MLNVASNNPSAIGRPRARIHGDPSLPLWTIWFVPTEKGAKAFGWTERRMGDPFHGTMSEARLERYMMASDGHVPDRDEYGIYEVRSGLGVKI